MTHIWRLLIAIACFILAGSPALAQLDRTQFDQIEHDIQEIRGLELLESFDVSTLNAEEYEQETIANFDDDYPPEDRAVDQRVLVAFGLLEPDDDLGESYLALLGGGVAGYYDPYTDEMVVITIGGSDDLGAFDQVTYAHETVHAMQDQHFDLSAILTAELTQNSDQSLAGRSLVEGDATVAEIEYLLSDPDLSRAYLDELTEADLDFDWLDELPLYLTASIQFPYNEGFEFVQYLYDQGGWDLVNESYDNLPVSTEQILHPELYLSGEMPQNVSVPDVSAEFGPEWQELDRDTMGEFLIDMMLSESDLSDDQVDLASAGWGGDEYSVIASDDDLAITWQTEWDTDEDAREFYRAMGIREEGRFDGTATDEDDVTTITADGVVVQLTLNGSTVTYLQAPNSEMIDELVAAS